MRSLFRRIRNLTAPGVATSLPDRVVLPALGETWSVRYRETAGRSVQARSNGEGKLLVSGRVGDPEMALQGMRRWLARHARRYLVPWLDELCQEAGLSYAAVSVRGQRTRWASCSARGNINLNYRLLFLPAEVVRYVLNHELCHTVHLNHSRAFWGMLAAMEPDFRMLNSLAKRGMEGVPEWARD